MILYGKTGEPAKRAHCAHIVFNNLRICNIGTESDSDPRLQLKQKGSHLNSVVCDCCWILPYHSRASPFLPHFARQQSGNCVIAQWEPLTRVSRALFRAEDEPEMGQLPTFGFPRPPIQSSDRYR